MSIPRRLFNPRIRLDSAPDPEVKGKIKREWCILDFVQIAHRERADGTLWSRMLLFVEDKPDDKDPTYRFEEAYDDSLHQVRFAFQNSLQQDSKAKIFGVILTVGKRWTYVEHDMSNFEPSPAGSEKKDPTSFLRQVLASLPI